MVDTQLGLGVRADDGAALKGVEDLGGMKAQHRQVAMTQYAAAVVLNRSHPYPDLVLMLDAHGKRVFDAIDGQRTVKEITDYTNVPGSDAGRLFQKLWWHDQVTFDASGGAERSARYLQGR